MPTRVQPILNSEKAERLREPIGPARRPVVMTTSSTMSPPRRRSFWPWLIAGTAVVVAAVVVTLALPKGTAGDSDARSTTPSSKPDTGYDLSTPQAAATSFAKAAKTGSGDELLSLACV